MEDKFDYPVQFQTDIISYLVNNANIFRRFIKHVKPSYFTEFQLKDIIESFIDFYGKFSDIPTKSTLITLINEKCVNDNGAKIVQDYSEYIDQIYNFNFNEKYVKEKLVEFVKIRAIYKALGDASKRIDQGSKVLEIMEKAVKTCDNVDFDPGYIYKDRKNVQERLDRLKVGIRTHNQIPTGIYDIDENLKDGLGAGELGCVIGVPNGGKTIVLLNIAMYAAIQGKTVLFCTMESTKEVIAGRSDHRLTNYNLDELKNRKDKMLYKVSTLAGNLIIKEFPKGVTSSQDIKNHVLDLKDNGIIVDMVVADYAGIMGANNKSVKERRFVIQDVCQGLIRDVAKFFNIPVWSAQQASQPKEDKNKHSGFNAVQSSKRQERRILRGKDISEAKTIIEAECDYIISINQSDEDRNFRPQRLFVFVIKNKFGLKYVTFELALNMDTFTISDTGTIVNQ